MSILRYLSANGSICPTQNWVYDLNNKIFKKEYGDPNGKGMINTMENFIEEYNIECGERCEIEYCVAFCSPLMKRIPIMLEPVKMVILLILQEIWIATIAEYFL